MFFYFLLICVKMTFLEIYFSSCLMTIVILQVEFFFDQTQQNLRRFLFFSFELVRLTLAKHNHSLLIGGLFDLEMSHSE
jgi:hypothetical protein